MAELTITLENLEFFIRVLVDEIDLEKRDPDEGKRFTTLALYHRTFGIAYYLLMANTMRTSDGLARSAQARLTHLQRVERGEAESHPKYGTTAKNRAFFDALVAGDMASSDALALACHSRWNPQFEYEDDYLFASFWHRFYLRLRSIPVPASADGVTEPRTLEATVERLEEVQGDGETPEVRLCRSVLDRDGEAFDAAMLELIEARDARLAKDLTLPPEFTATEGHVFVNGLGMVLLARMNDVPTAREYPTIPAPLLSLGSRAPAPDGAWRRIG